MPEMGAQKPVHVPLRMTLKGLELQIARHWCLASYLILNHDIRELEELIELDLPQDFAAKMAGFVYGYIYESKMPPTEIAQTVLNVSEDMAAGRQVSLRAGDYIAAQKFFRASAKGGRPA